MKRLLKWLFPMGLVRFADDPGGGGGAGGGGEAWHAAVEGVEPDVAQTLSSFGSQADAFKALHESRTATLGKYISDSPDLMADEFVKGLADKPVKDSVASLAKEVKELRVLKGRKGLSIPGEKATEQEKAEFTKQLNTLRGVPESPEKYQYKLPDEVLSSLDKEQFSARLKQFHEAGFSSEQVQAGLNMFLEEAGYLTEKANKAVEGWKAETQTWAKQTWGAEADANMALAERAMQKMGVLDDFKASGFANKKGVVDSFYQLAVVLGEGKLPAAGGAGGTFEQQIEALKAAPGYGDPRHPDYPALQKKREELYKNQYGKRG